MKPEVKQFHSGFVPYAVLFITAFTLYLKTIGYDFLPSWDDNVYVQDNPYIRGLSLQNIWGAVTTVIAGNYAPLHILSYAADFALWGLDPKGFHLTNVILHGLNACAVYAVIAKVSGKKDVAFVASLLFAVHPLNVENVAWISERKSLLASFFFLLAISCYLDYRYYGRSRSYVAAVMLFLPAVLSKASVVVLPLILAACELYIVKGDRKWKPLLPFIFISVLAAASEVWAHLSSNIIREGVLSPGFLFDTVYPTMLPVFWKYAWLIIWPLNLSAYYDTTDYHSFLAPAVFVSLAAWILVFAIVFTKGSPQVRFWFLWFWFCLLPVSNIVPIPVYFADRYMYMPAVAFFVLFASFLKTTAGTVSGPDVAIKKAAYYTVISLTLLLCLVMSYKRADVWKNDLALWKDTVIESPNQYRVHMILGFVYEMDRHLDDAEREYLTAIALCTSNKDELESRLRRVRTKMRISREIGIY